MDIEKECSLLGTLFQNIVTDLKSSSPVWEEFVSRGMKLYTLLKSTTFAVSAFVESMQKIADNATNTKGSTKDIGSALTRICVRQKMVENKLKQFTNALLENLISPIQDRLEEWKKVANQLEKDHAKEYKKAMHDIKKRNGDTLRLQKKARKGSKPDIQFQLNSAMHDVNERLTLLEETEKSALRNLLVEERTRVCLFANCLTPVLESQISMMNEVSHLHELGSDVTRLCRNPKQLPTSTDQLVQDFVCINGQAPNSPLPDGSNLNNGGFGTFNASSPPASPGLSGSRKSSLCSLNSSDSRSSGSLNHNTSSTFHHHRYQSFHRRTNSSSTSTTTTGQGSPTSCKSAPAGSAVARLSSVSSHDSGFVSQGNSNVTMPPINLSSNETNPQITAKPPLPNDKNLDNTTDIVSPLIRTRPNSAQLPDSVVPLSGPNRPLSWKDWSRPGPYDQQPPSSPNPNHILPSKPTGPPVLSPRPHHGTLQHRQSLGGFSEGKAPPPMLRHVSEPHFAGSSHVTVDGGLKSPERPPKPAAFIFTGTQEVDEDSLPLPPPPDLAPGEAPASDEPLPPPPPEEITNGQGPIHEPKPPVQPAKDEMKLTRPLYATPNPIQGEFTCMTLGRKNSNHSLQYSSSSGYSSQNTTPACSEDTIASHDTDYSSTNGDDVTGHVDYQTWSTMPRSRDNHHGNARNRRPASTAGVPTMISTQITSPGTATIRRKPSSKFNSVRRTSNVPKPVQPPTVPQSPVTKLMSTFLPPDSNELANQHFNNGYCYNTNNNNHGSMTSNYDDTMEQSDVVRDLTLKFKQSVDMRDGSPTPTDTPVRDVMAGYSPPISGVGPFYGQQ
uniref:Metastasis suppressor protein 1 n=1 Tax=Phallusia mammillata TaxID=59560 RepID=A0A6F9DLL1_9ASCI|nr:metastasis suppressor protein 1 [Phallusia mammillata]